MFSEQMKRRERRGEQENASWCIICLCEIIKGDQLIEALCVSPVMILLTALFFFLSHWIITHLHQAAVLQSRPNLPAFWL